ncbi:MAG: methyltransferase domain-containing protein [Alphaproteobacteria bacterium]|nr:methyltransferase domain-containing protein [Alphaproteobacteria bacterium]
MAQADKIFSSSIASIYDDLMGPVFFAPYAEDLGRRASALKPATILETAAGSGISTEALVKAAPGAALTAVDLNQAMIDVASAKPGLNKVQWQACDATKLPFADGLFDLVACQFGVMFFPDKVAAFAETRRVLKPGGSFIFSVWDALDVNPVPDAVLWELAKLFPANPPSFMRRLPHGFFDVPELTRALLAAGFSKVAAEHVELACNAPSARHLAIALCQGTPMRPEIEALSPGRLEEVTEAVAAGLARKFGNGEVRSTMQAIVFEAKS